MTGAPPAPFIVGVNRSGTTLLRLMLDAHPDLAIPAETHFLPRLIERWQRFDERGVPEPERRRLVVERITGHPRWPDLEIGAGELAAHLEALAPVAAADVLRAVHLVHARAQGKERWGEKTPSYLSAMLPIAATLPEARFVHLVRDGRDVAVSLGEMSWGTAEVEDAAETWSREILAARRDAAELPPGRYVEVRYERLVADPRATLGEIAGFIELPWDDAMLSHETRARQRLSVLHRDRIGRDGRVAVSAADRKAQHATAAQPVRGDRVGRWRAEMRHTERERFESVAGELLAELGYG